MPVRTLYTDVDIEDTINLLARNLKYEFNEQIESRFYLENGHIRVSAEPFYLEKDNPFLDSNSVPHDLKTIIRIEDRMGDPSGDNPFSPEGRESYEKIMNNLFLKPPVIFDNDRKGIMAPPRKMVE
jgi:hypothetical protein